MNFRTLLGCPILGLLFLVSCSDETETGEAGNLPEKEIKESATDTFLELEMYTRASYSDNHLPGENAVRSAGIHIFNEDGSRDSITPYIFIEKEANIFTVGVTPGQKTVITILNANSEQLTGYDPSLWENLTVDRIIPNPLGNANIAGGINSEWTGIPMTGKGSGYVEKGKTTIIPVEGLRLLSRINSPTTLGTLVTLSPEEKERLEAETGKTFGDQLTFRLEGHIMINGAKKYKIFPNYGVANEYDRWNISSWMEAQAYHKTTYRDGELVSAYGGKEFLTHDTVIYVYENTPRIANYNQNGPIYEYDSVYAFILRGTLTDNNGTSATRYWRLNIGQNSILNGHQVATYQILRNAIYSTNIRNVLTSGYETPEEAEENESEIIADSVVIDWNKEEIITDM